MSELGRQVKYGIGIGSDVAASQWFNHLEFDLKPVNQYINNESAWGNIVRTNSSLVARQYTEGSLIEKLTPNRAGYILLGAFGSVSTADHADSNAAVKNHTFNINEDINGQAVTLYKKDSLQTLKYTGGRIGEWSLQMELDDYIKFSANIMALKGVSTTATPAFIEDAEFVAKHFSIKSASSVAGLSGATAVSGVQSLTLTMNPNLEADNEAGNDEPMGFSSRGFELSFEMTCRYNDTTFETACNNGTELAFQVSAVNTDVTIGAAANPGLVLTAARVNITDWSPTGGLDAPLDQTITGTIHYSPADAYALRAVLTNTTASYA